MKTEELVGIGVIGSVMLGVVLFWGDIRKKLDLMYWYNKLPEYQFGGLPDVSSIEDFIEKYGMTPREYLQGTYQEYEQHLSDAAEKAAETIRDAVRDATESITESRETISDVVEDIQKGGGDYPDREENLLDNLKDWTNDVVEKVDEVVDTIVTDTRGGGGRRYR